MPPKKPATKRSDPTEEFEKLGVFYLGRPYDHGANRVKPGWLLYDSKDLVTHAVCVGMTGSGKTGLCIGLLEEAAIDGIPALIIDPKGDLANLMLTFPRLRGEDFAPWIDEEEARKRGLSPTAYAVQQAELWRQGLAEWGQSPERIQRFKDAAEVAIYTPGSNAGRPLSILKSFAAPSPEILEDPESLRERIGATVTGLLGLIGVQADPIRSREHILLSTLLDQAWRRGEDLDIAALVHRLHSPPVTKVGVLDLESFYPAKDRFALSMQLNNLLAAPGFSAWTEGAPLDIPSLLYTEEGKPRLAVLSIAHLTEPERMFFVTLLLNQVVGWIRTQSGTTSLRAILYMDEIFGYFPPVANPPSKTPLLTLLKQARAFGLGVVLATQNPVDLDYKGLSNTGTWFIGRLQTERDKARVLEGLEGIAAGTGRRFDTTILERLLAGLGNRVFLLNNVHENAPEVFQTRWTLSYLRGPLTRAQIKTLMQDGSSPEARGVQIDPLQPSPVQRPTSAASPILPPGVPHYFVPLRGWPPDGSALVYLPMLLGSAHVRFVSAKVGVDTAREVTMMAPFSQRAVFVGWDQAVEAGVQVSDLEGSPTDGGQFAALPREAAKPGSYERWRRDFAGWLFRTQKIELFRSPATEQISRPEESERDFRLRLQQHSRERRDQQAEALRRKYAPKIAVLQERIRRAEHTVARQTAESRASQVQTIISVGATILGAFLGRKTLSSSNVGRATTAIRGAGRVLKETQDVGAAKENVAALQRQLAELEARFESEADALAAANDPLSERLETVTLKPSKTHIDVTLVALAWTPYWRDAEGGLTPAWR